MSDLASCLELTLQAHSPQGDSPKHLLSELHLQATFRPFVVPLLEGSVRFGLRGGCLRAVPTSCRFASLENALTPSLPASRRETEGAPAWLLALPPSEGILEGDRPAVLLGTLQTAERVWILELTYTLDPADPYVLSADDCWSGSPTPNQQAVLLQCFQQFLFVHCLLSPLCLLRLSAGHVEATAAATTVAPPDAAVAKLRETRDRLLSATGDNFGQLCVLAELDPRQDLQGANLTSARLSNCDLSEGTLARANLRGAYLCDADLSGTDLRATKLNGADLSGAQLGSADLRGSFCHRASFALANLGGADLRGADLQGANLKQANLNGAKVEGLRLGNNPGLTATQIADLSVRGAILPE